MKLKKIKFKNLLDIGGGYDFCTCLEVLNWMLKTGENYTRQSGWYRHGVDKQIFGYSANNHESKSPIKQDLRLYFLNAIVSEADTIVKQWREKHGIRLDRSFMLKHNPSEYFESNFTKKWHFINSLVEKPLIKEFYQPEYPERVNPRITQVKVCSIGKGIEIEYRFTFDCHPGGSWQGTFLGQAEHESVSQFFDRAVEYFEERLAV